MKNLIVLTSFFIAMAFTFSCGSSNQTSENVDSTKVDEPQIDDEPSDENSITITAKYISGGALEGDADLVFEKEDGTEILFYRNYTNPKEPELKYMLIGEDGASANPKYIGQTFTIQYQLNQKGRLSIITGEMEPCNQILSIEKK